MKSYTRRSLCLNSIYDNICPFTAYRVEDIEEVSFFSRVCSCYLWWCPRMGRVLTNGELGNGSLDSAQGAYPYYRFGCFIGFVMARLCKRI